MAQLGDSWEVKEELMDVMETFTYCMYNRPRFGKVDELRHRVLKEKCADEVISASQNTDLGTLPSCRHSLRQHVHRCNYQVVIWNVQTYHSQTSFHQLMGMGSSCTVVF